LHHHVFSISLLRDILKFNRTIIIIIIITQLATLHKSVEQNDKLQGWKQSRNLLGNQ